MPSPRETYKKELLTAHPLAAAGTWTSDSVDVMGRMKMTFLIFCSVNCAATIEWSFDGLSEDSWHPLYGLIAIPVVGGRLMRITVDDALTYLRIRINGSVAPGSLSVWSVSI